MSWVENNEYQSAEIEPLFLNSQEIINHMKEDHSDANILYAQKLANLHDCTEAAMLGIDRYGVTLRASTSKGPRMARIGFPTPLNNHEEARPAVIELLELAKSTSNQKSKANE